MENLLNFIAALSIIIILMVLVSVRRAHIRVEYSVSWLGASLTLLVLSRCPGALERAATALGITYPPLVLVLLVGCIFLLVLFRFSIVISALKDANIALAQRVAILEFHLHTAHEEKQTQS